MFGYDLYRAPSVAMSPTIERDDFFLVDAWRYHHHAPAAAEVVVLHLNDGTGTKYVKRIVGIPGDRIDLRDSTLFRNGQPVTEPYVRLVAPFPSYGRDYGPIWFRPIRSSFWGAIAITVSIAANGARSRSVRYRGGPSHLALFGRRSLSSKPNRDRSAPPRIGSQRTDVGRSLR